MEGAGMTISPFLLRNPVSLRTPVVFASPHSGNYYPASFLARSLLDDQVIRSSEDAFVDRLFDCVPRLGAPFLCANYPRAYLDLNRAAEELDPAVIEGVRKVGHNPRVSSGLGVIPRVVANGRPIYRGKLTYAEAKGRIDSIWFPYHQTLSDVLNQAHRVFGQAILLDCHSMPREALDVASFPEGKRPDIVLGDRFGAAANPDITDAVEAAFKGAGFRVARNTPFAGAYIVRQYGRPSRNQHAVQIEIDRSIYMDEGQIVPHSGFDRLRRVLRSVVAELVELGTDRGRLAAE
jgi:N-formylglutamate deformylase